MTAATMIDRAALCLAVAAREWDCDVAFNAYMQRAVEWMERAYDATDDMSIADARVVIRETRTDVARAVWAYQRDFCAGTIS